MKAKHTQGQTRVATATIWIGDYSVLVHYVYASNDSPEAVAGKMRAAVINALNATAGQFGCKVVPI